MSTGQARTQGSDSDCEEGLVSPTGLRMTKALGFYGRTSQKGFLVVLMLCLSFTGILFVLSNGVSLRGFVEEKPRGWFFLNLLPILSLAYFGGRRMNDAGSCPVSYLAFLSAEHPSSFLGTGMSVDIEHTENSFVGSLFALFTGIVQFALASLCYSHDVSKPFYPLLSFCLTVCAGMLLLRFGVFKLLLRPSQPGPNRYGPNPNEVFQ